MNKAEVRKYVKQLKAEMSESRKLAEATIVWQKVEMLDEFKKAKNILLYYSLHDELPTHEFVERWHKGKNIYLPKVSGEDLQIIKYDGTNLQQGSFKIYEPVGEPVEPSIIDIIIVPGIAFDMSCNRMGRGRGFYDRLLRATKALKIGVAFDCQIQKVVPTDDHDIPMNFVISRSISLIALKNL